VTDRQVHGYAPIRSVGDIALMDKVGTPYVFAADLVGTTACLLDSAAAVTSSYTYDAFGVGRTVSETVSNLYRFGTRRLDTDSGLYHFIARQYAPEEGRFVTRDLRVPGPSYRYLSGPLRRVDPRGSQPYDPEEVFNDCLLDKYDVLLDIWNSEHHLDERELAIPVEQREERLQQIRKLCGDGEFKGVCELTCGPFEPPPPANPPASTPSFPLLPPSACRAYVTAPCRSLSLCEICRYFPASLAGGNATWVMCVRGCLLADWNPTTCDYDSGLAQRHLYCWSYCDVMYAMTHLYPIPM
jgi:RHS repeat-associated protein